MSLAGLVERTLMIIHPELMATYQTEEDWRSIRFLNIRQRPTVPIRFGGQVGGCLIPSCLLRQTEPWPIPHLPSQIQDGQRCCCHSIGNRSHSKQVGRLWRACGNLQGSETAMRQVIGCLWHGHWWQEEEYTWGVKILEGFKVNCLAQS